MEKAEKHSQWKIAESCTAKAAKARPDHWETQLQIHGCHPALSLYRQETILPVFLPPWKVQEA